MPDDRALARLMAFTAAWMCFASVALAAAPHGRKPLATHLAHAIVNNDIQRIDANDLRMVVTNVGSFGYDLSNGGPGLEFPSGSGKTALFAGGLWLGARVNGQTRVAVSEYSSEYLPGAIVGGIPDNNGDPAYVVYKLRRDNSDPAALAAYAAGAEPHGAPHVTVLPDNTLDIPGDQMLWSVYNDAFPQPHNTIPGSTSPLFVEIQQTTFAYDDPGPLGRTLFMTFKVINKSPNTLDSLRIALWTDPDLGGFADDLEGSVPQTPLGYAYNGTNNDLVYGTFPPALGLTFLEWGHPSTPAFVVYANGAGPQDGQESFLYMQGRYPSGDPIVDPDTGTPFMFAGDPVAGTGALDSSPGDRRMLLSVGPLTVAPGDTVTSSWALVIGQENDRLGSVARLRCDVDAIRNFWFNRNSNPPRPSGLSCADLPSCPRSSGFWNDQCGPAQDFNAQQIGAIAQRIDTRSTYFNWTASPFDSFCAIFAGGQTERSRAEREYASLLANLSADTLHPASGYTVSLHNVPVSCGGLDGQTILDLAGLATVRLDADYLDLVATHAVPIEGDPYTIEGTVLGALSSFNGGATAGNGYSRLDPLSQPDSFPRVELRFGPGQPAHRFLRFENANGNAPPNFPAGRAYLHAGDFAVPFTVWDTDRNVQLEVAFTERVLVDDDGTIQPSSFQPATFDSVWSPDSSIMGGRELLYVFKYDLGTGESALSANNAFLGGNLPILYRLWVRRITSASVFDAGDAFVFDVNLVGPSVDRRMLELANVPEAQANATYTQIADCLSLINRGIGIGPTCDLETAVLFSLIRADAGPDGISITWYASKPVSVGIERRVDDGGWIGVATRTSDGSGRIGFDDTDVSAGHRYAYRLRYRDGAGERVAGETSLELPATARVRLAGFTPNPARGRPGVSFSLATDHPATLTIHDIAGRRVGSYAVGQLGRGTHLLLLEDRNLSSGLYLLKLNQDGTTSTTRSVLVR